MARREGRFGARRLIELCVCLGLCFLTPICLAITSDFSATAGPTTAPPAPSTPPEIVVSKFEELQGAIELKEQRLKINARNEILFTSEVTIRHDVQIYGSSPNRPQLSGMHKSTLFHVTGKTLKLSRLTVMNGTVGIRVVNHGRLVLDDCVFIGNRAVRKGKNNGGAIFVNRGELIANNTEFMHNVAGVYGGAMYVATNSRATIKHSRFEKNRAVLGGAVYFVSSASNNDRHELRVMASEFVHNSAEWGGGALWVSRGSVNITNSSFHSNVVHNTSNDREYAQQGVGGSGGAVFMNGTNGTVRQCVFEQNSARALGGALFLGFTPRRIVTPLTLDRLHFFNNNVSKFGGGVAIFEAHVNVTHSNITGNTAISSACGGLLMLGEAMVTTVATIFQDNVAEHLQGGGVCVLNSTYHGYDTNFSGNVAPGGGGLFVSRSAKLHCDRCMIMNNSAANGAGILVEHSTDNAIVQCIREVMSDSVNGSMVVYADNMGDRIDSTLAHLKRSNISFNRATGEKGVGGGLWCSDSRFLCDGCLFSNNSAKGPGGAIFVNKSGKVELEYTTLDKNYSPDINSSALRGETESKVLTAGLRLGSLQRCTYDYTCRHDLYQTMWLDGTRIPYSYLKKVLKNPGVFHIEVITRPCESGSYSVDGIMPVIESKNAPFTTQPQGRVELAERNVTCVFGGKPPLTEEEVKVYYEKHKNSICVVHECATCPSGVYRVCTSSLTDGTCAGRFLPLSLDRDDHIHRDDCISCMICRCVNVYSSASGPVGRYLSDDATDRLLHDEEPDCKVCHIWSKLRIKHSHAALPSGKVF